MKNKYYSYEFVISKNRKLKKMYLSGEKEKAQDQIIINTLPLLREMIEVFSEDYDWDKEYMTSEATVKLCEIIKGCSSWIRTAEVVRRLEEWIMKGEESQPAPKKEYSVSPSDLPFIEKYAKEVIWSDRDYIIFKSVVCEGATLAELSSDLGLGRERVRQLYVRALSKLRDERTRRTPRYRKLRDVVYGA